MIKVLSAGFYTTIQDLGRKNYRNIGVPVSGVMDSFSAKLANHLLNNEITDAVLEITFGTCKLEFLNDTIICVTGACFSAKLNDNLIKLNTVILVKKGSILSFGKRNYGVRTYIGVLGGFQTEEILKSRSFYKGITADFLIRKNDILSVLELNKNGIVTNSSIKVSKNNFESEIIECFKGPEFDLLSEKQIEKLQKTLFTISTDNNRMGYRLKEEVVNSFTSMLTSAVLSGTVQLTPSGKLIVLMRDCQVTGGYPRVLQLSENAINILAQKTSGDSFRFSIK